MVDNFAEHTPEWMLLERGRAEGRMLKLISLIRIKMTKGKSEIEIADELEEDEMFVLWVMELLDAGPGRLVLQICAQCEAYPGQGSCLCPGSTAAVP